MYFFSAGYLLITIIGPVAKICKKFYLCLEQDMESNRKGLVH